MISANKLQFMYELDPPQEWLDYQAGNPPQQKIGPDGKAMLELHPRPGKSKRALLDFPHMKAIDKVIWIGPMSQSHANNLRSAPMKAGGGGR